MKIGTKIFKKILAKPKPTNFKRIIHHDQVEFISGMQRFFNSHISSNMMHHINKVKNKKHMIISIDAEKAFVNSTSVYYKNAPETGHRGNIPQHYKGHV